MGVIVTRFPIQFFIIKMEKEKIPTIMGGGCPEYNKMEKEFNLTKEKKEALAKAKNFKENYNCYDCYNCSDCSDCSNCSYCYNCSFCSECSYCSDQKNKKYMICNVQFTKEEYEAWKKNLI